MDGPRSARFFEFLSEEERRELAEVAEPVAFLPGEALIEEGGESSSLFILTSGSVEVCKRISGRGERLLAILDTADERTVVGERGLFSDRGASATVRARREVEAVKIPRERFRRMISDGRPAAYKLAYRIAHTLAGRLRRLDEEVVETVRELSRRGETDLEAFRDKLFTQWTL